MASIENLTLRTLPNPGDVNLLDVRVTFTVFFSEFDFFSHLPYQECIRIFGIDTIAFAGEDNTDDLLIDGFSITTVSPPPRGIPGLNRDVRMAVQRRSLDEDQPPAPNPDELQAYHPDSPATRGGHSKEQHRCPQYLVATPHMARTDLDKLAHGHPGEQLAALRTRSEIT